MLCSLIVAMAVVGQEPAPKLDADSQKQLQDLGERFTVALRTKDSKAFAACWATKEKYMEWQRKRQPGINDEGIKHYEDYYKYVLAKVDKVLTPITDDLRKAGDLGGLKFDELKLSDETNITALGGFRGTGPVIVITSSGTKRFKFYLEGAVQADGKWYFAEQFQGYFEEQMPK